MDGERKVTMAILIFLAAVGSMALFLAVRAPADICTEKYVQLDKCQADLRERMRPK